MKRYLKKHFWYGFLIPAVSLTAVISTSCDNTNKKYSQWGLDASNPYQFKLGKLMFQLPSEKFNVYIPKIQAVDNEEKYVQIEKELKSEIKRHEMQNYKQEQIAQLQSLNNLNQSEIDEFQKEIVEAYSYSAIDKAIAKAEYLNKSKEVRYANMPEKRTYIDNLEVKPSDKDFKFWADPSFTKFIDMNKLSYLDMPNKVQMIAPFNNNHPKTSLMYQLTVYSFADGNNDGIGDFIGLKENLDYFEKLGVDALYLSPVFPASSYHGYDVIDYTDIAPELGGMEAFDQFLILAHQKGIRVILDVPFNHTSYEHPWFQEALKGNEKYQSYYNFYNVYSDTKLNAEQRDEPWLKSMYTHIDQKVPLASKAWTGYFWAGMPDLNLNNDLVKDEINAVHEFWAKKGIDGFRYDAFYHIFDNYNPNKHGENGSSTNKTTSAFVSWRKAANKGLEARTNSNITSSTDDFFMFGEWWGSVYDANKYFKFLNIKSLGSVIDGHNYKTKEYNTSTGELVKSVYLTPNEEKSVINNLNSYHAEWMPFLDNHDIERWINEVKWKITHSNVTNKPSVLTQDEIDAYNYALTSLLSRGGLPILYDGNELYMQGGPKSGEGNGDYNIRESFNWEDPSKVVYFFEKKSGDLISKRASFGNPSIEKMIADPNSGFNLVSKLAQIRQNYPAAREQKVEYITEPSLLFDNLTPDKEKMITVRDNQDGTYLVYFYGYKPTGNLDNLTLKNNYQIQKELINKNIVTNSNVFNNKTSGFIGVFVISTK
ncbi:alpha-amylase family glycosyl hydrolase [Mycoplasmopsis glycophila]|uniref:Alpha-amylase n=1 Tax=Mycoplasmopsis glycophila TaxID=171285 RepID=A0A449AUD7_9BACT|nr:alpha-amylase family glycosyl hydrolase [Mycoplasmopsis glycophila]VEU70131.1 Alpha-amylase [Mycoplasmopsis glycophila]